MLGELETDAEKYSDAAVRQVFRRPPGLPDRFSRSTLLVGARGSGKTLFLRRQKLDHRGISAYFNLTAEFSSITKQTGLGAVAYDTPPQLSSAIPGKATSLLALSLYAKFIFRKGLASTARLRGALAGCMPKAIAFSESDLMDQTEIDRIRIALSTASIETFEGVAFDAPLVRLLGEFGRICQQQELPLLVLFDKSDQAVPDATVPVLDTLNQSPSYTAVLAIRPGYTSRAMTEACALAPPGDHFDLLHLGATPSGEDWRAFQLEAARAHFRDQTMVPHLLRADDSILLDTLFFVSRDCIRFALKQLARDPSTPNAIQHCLKEERGFLESATMSALPKYFMRSEDYRALLTSIQRQTSTQSSLRPVQMQVTKAKAGGLFDENESVDRFLEAGLRSGAFSMVEGTPWSPGVQLREVEVSPLLAWYHKDFVPFKRDASEPLVAERDETQLKKSFAGAKAAESIFIAYRMEYEASNLFKSRLNDALSHNTSFKNFHLTDGNTNLGNKDWPTAVRDKIKQARMVIGDITGERVEVMFEMGFARGLRAPSISVVERREQRGNLPEWHSREQVGSFEGESDMVHLLQNITQVLRNPALRRPRTALSPEPQSVVWLRMKDWTLQCRAQFERELTTRNRTLLPFDTDDLDTSALEEAARASLLVAVLDGTAADVFVHYVCGAIVATPRAGQGDHRLQRQVILITQDGKSKSDVVAKSLRHCTSSVQVVSPEMLVAKSKPHLNKYDVWLNKPPTKD